MTRAMVFDSDGTLVQAERLQAASYARAAAELCGEAIGEEDVIEAFKQVLGRSRREVAVAPVERFGLEEAALGANIWCIAVTTPLTRQAIRAARLFDERWVADDPATLTAIARGMVEERKLD